MSFTPSIQSLNGPQVPTGGQQCAVNWDNDLAVIGTGSLYVANVGINKGLEGSFAPTTAGQFPPVGRDAAGRIYASKNASLSTGGIQQLDGVSFAQIAAGAYPLNVFGGAAFANVPVGSNQYMVDIGDGLIGGTRHTIVSLDTVYVGSETWPSGLHNGFVCQGSLPAQTAFILFSPGGSDPQVLTLRSVGISGGGAVTFSTVGTVAAAAIDATWTNVLTNGICLDQTDGNLLAVVYTTDSVTQHIYLIKIKVSDGSVLWQTALPDTVPFSVPGGQQLAESQIRFQRIGIVNVHSGSVPLGVTIINTATGAVVSSYTAGLAGAVTQGAQAYSDSISAILGRFQFSQTTGSPTRLNATPSSYTGWMVLYVAAPPPRTGKKAMGFLGLSRVMGPGPAPPPGPDFRITEAGDQRVTETGDLRITE